MLRKTAMDESRRTDILKDVMNETKKLEQWDLTTT
jgi:hypothetical protein